MIGMDGRTGAFSDDLAHLRQSIADILTTPSARACSVVSTARCCPS